MSNSTASLSQSLPPSSRRSFQPAGLVAASVLAAALAAGCIAEDEPPLIGVHSSEIVGGETVDWQQYPWTAQIWDERTLRPDKKFCTGSLIAPTWVMSAAHCSDSDDYKADYVKLYGQRIEIAEKILHPLWSPPLDGIPVPFDGSDDIALFRLEAATDVDPMPINRDVGVPGAGNQVTVLGWGRTAHNGDLASELQRTELTVTDQETCTNIYRYNGAGPGQMCSRGPTQSVCGGDSGGPSVSTGVGGSLVVGVTTAASGTCAEDFPGLHQRAAAYADWIASYVPEASFVSPTAIMSAIL